MKDKRVEKKWAGQRTEGLDLDYFIPPNTHQENKNQRDQGSKTLDFKGIIDYWSRLKNKESCFFF